MQFSWLNLKFELPKSAEDLGKAETNTTRRAKLVQLVRQMLSADPVRRPTVKDVLDGELLPPPPERDAAFEQTFLKCLRQPRARLYKWMLAVRT